MKKNFILVIISAVIILGACSNSSNENSKDELENTNTGKMINDFKIDFLSAKKLASDEGEVLQVNFKVENKYADSRVFDSYFLTATNKDNENLEIAPKENFSDNLKPGEEKEGAVYFYFEGTEPVTLTYDDLENPKEEVTVIQKVELLIFRFLGI